MSRALTNSEHEAIFQILEEEESKLGGIKFNADKISALDKKCKQIFPNWEASPTRKPNFGLKSRETSLISDLNFSNQEFSNQAPNFSSAFPQTIIKDLESNATSLRSSQNFDVDRSPKNSTTFNYDIISESPKPTTLNSNIRTPSPAKQNINFNINTSNIYSDTKYTSPKKNNLSEPDDDINYLKNDLENLMQELRSVTKQQPSPIPSPKLSTPLNHSEFNYSNSPSFKDSNISNQPLSPTINSGQISTPNSLSTEKKTFENTSIPKMQLSVNASPLDIDQNENSMSLPMNLQLQQENIKIKAQLMQIKKELEAEKSENDNLRRSLKKSEELRIYYRQQFENLQAQLQKPNN